MVRTSAARVEVMTFLLGIWLAVSGLAGAALIALGVLYQSWEAPAYFPGDAPLADLCVDLALAGWLFIAIGLVAARAMSRFIDRTSTLRVATRILTGLLVLSCVTLAPALARVAGRQFGEWRQLRALLVEGEARARTYARSQDGVLTRDEFEQARAWFQAHPDHFSFKFKELPQPVRVQVMTSRPPYVGVHFGGGSNAVFDLTTMRCTYSD
ncbi:hypothetical protein HPC49_14405 [Pyxidicoccus fallax]|uniref:Uncharacterized protein n=1 Tax=Pyxidicoccus fallax TaxID=394095 RepID=A0A848LK78_9BACT|nr:hypothetical protein [Pyxidicoccus fallax]NMO18129.1 hypothetical protein [Pyxidicoccus fallax]NPC79423.1 hypothetical protein [Pyxidicoccus fallax]